MRVTDKRITKDFLFEKQDGMCAYCEDILPVKLLTLDHVKPIVRGGTDDIDNLVLCCRWCNQVKSNTDAWRFKKFVAFLEGKRPKGEALGDALRKFTRKTGVRLY